MDELDIHRARLSAELAELRNQTSVHIAALQRALRQVHAYSQREVRQLRAQMNGAAVEADRASDVEDGTHTPLDGSSRSRSHSTVGADTGVAEQEKGESMGESNLEHHGVDAATGRRIEYEHT